MHLDSILGQQRRSSCSIGLVVMIRLVDGYLRSQDHGSASSYLVDILVVGCTDISLVSLLMESLTFLSLTLNPHSTALPSNSQFFNSPNCPLSTTLKDTPRAPHHQTLAPTYQKQVTTLGNLQQKKLRIPSSKHENCLLYFTFSYHTNACHQGPRKTQTFIAPTYLPSVPLHLLYKNNNKNNNRFQNLILTLP